MVADQRQLKVENLGRWALMIAIVLVLGAGALRGLNMAVSVLVGSGLALINFRWMLGGVDALLYGKKLKRRAAVVIAKYLGRLLLIIVVLFAIIQTSYLSPVGVVVGLSIVVLSGFLEAFRFMLKAKF